ncbi:unnamed protein product [Mycena citricolor]|uniref:Uncharacterized protein n=1 Tax=Mycena citricolor TaxID=2018698 RepID=A0AAD2Q295_9AGAR|nr:unnamed protein product [Mycena citricolor]CAK5273614.1 unnamed protein product [Mycena citricolor]
MADTAASSSAPLPSRRLLGKSVIVTGAGGAIGVETSGRLLLEGANLVLVDISAAALEAAVAKLAPFLAPDEPADTRILSVSADVASEAAVADFTAQTVAKFGRVDCAFLNAGINDPATSIFDTTEARFEKIMRVNVTSAFLGIKHIGKAMKEAGAGGSIVLTSSIAGLRGTPGMTPYSASKFAVRGLALTAAGELGPFGIRVNTIHPSGVNTPMFQNSWSPEKMAELKKAMPLGRFAETHDIPGVVCFLFGDDSKFMTGGFLKIDGGCVSF